MNINNIALVLRRRPSWWRMVVLSSSSSWSLLPSSAAGVIDTRRRTVTTTAVSKPAMTNRSSRAVIAATGTSLRWQSTLFRATWPLSMPIKTVNVLALPTRTAKFTKQPALTGSFVEAGDVVAILKSSENEKEDQTDVVEITAPVTGRLVKVLSELDETVTVGDPLFEIDTDAIDATSALEQQLIDHLQNNDGNLDDTFWKEMLESTDTDVTKMRQLASLIRDKFPKWRPATLKIYETILNLTKDKEMIATTNTDIGTVLATLGDIDTAIVHLERALEIRQNDILQDENHPDLVGSIIYVGALKNQMGDLDGAFEMFQRALDIQKSALGENHSLVAASTNNLGAIRYQQGQFDDALQYYRQALQIHKDLLMKKKKGNVEDNDENVDIAGCHQNIGVALRHKKDHAGALDHTQTALRIRQKLLGSDHLDTAASHYCLAQLFSEMGEFAGSLEQFQAAYDIQFRHYGKHPIPASTMVNMGAVYYQQQQYDTALEKYREGLDMLIETMGSGHLDVASAHNNCGLALYQKGSFDESLEQHKKAYQIIVKHFGGDENHPSLAATIGSIGNVYKRQRKLDDALEQYRKAHQLLETALGESHPDVGSSYNNMGQVLAGQGKLDESLMVYRAAQKVFQETLGALHPHTGSCHYNAGLVLKEMRNKNAEAVTEFECARDIWSSSLGPDHPQTTSVESLIQELS